MIPPSNNRIEESCSCGATFKASGSFVASSALAWRRDHHHVRSVGICGMSMHVKGGCQPDPICDLPAGHEGWHETSTGSRWGYRRYQTESDARETK